jgi:2-deoxy-D-gluconate 3-dehydrogenase
MNEITASNTGDTEFSSSLAFVTGGARGIGRAVADELVARGLEVVIGDLPSSAVETGSIPQVAFDVSDYDSVEAAHAEIVGLFGRAPDVLVNNAGINVTGASADLPKDDWLRVVDVNLNGLWYVTQRFGRSMIESGRGSIVNISSINATLGMPGRASYAATKAAVLGLTKSLAVEWAPHHVRVNAIQPGYIMTDLVAQAMAAGFYSEDELSNRIPLNHVGETSDIASAVAFLASPDAAYITGHSLVVDGGYTILGSVKGASTPPAPTFRPDSYGD